MRRQVDFALEVRDALSEARLAVHRIEEARERGGGRLAAEIEAVEKELVTEPRRYSRPMLVDQLQYLYGNLTRADQEPGEDAVRRYDQLNTVLQGHIRTLERLLRANISDGGGRAYQEGLSTEEGDHHEVSPSHRAVASGWVLVSALATGLIVGAVGERNLADAKEELRESLVDVESKEFAFMWERDMADLHNRLMELLRVLRETRGATCSTAHGDVGGKAVGGGTGAQQGTATYARRQ